LTAPHSGQIPQNILQFWHDKNCVPVEMREAIDGTSVNNPDYRVSLADDEEVRSLLSSKYDTCLLKLYELLRLPASRSDLARLVMLHEFGGFYLDASMQFHISLNEFLVGDPELILVRRDDVPKYRDCPDRAHVMGGIIGAPARSPFIAQCITLLVENLVCGTFNTEAWRAAGPGVINKTLRTYQATRLVRLLSFTELLQGRVSYRRSPGVSNVWVQKQMEGIIDPALYDNARKELDLSS
jgi:mannosyltransferase OCH1-like enzyme